METESNLLRHAKVELAALRGHEPDDMQDEIEKCVLDIVRVFAAQEHSGSSAPYVIGLLTKLLAFEPVAPLTGADEEWFEHSSDNFQNKRCGRVFKNGRDAPAYDIEGKVFREPNGACFTNRDSRVYVTFPYRPATEIVDVPHDRP